MKNDAPSETPMLPMRKKGRRIRRKLPSLPFNLIISGVSQLLEIKASPKSDGELHPFLRDAPPEAFGDNDYRSLTAREAKYKLKQIKDKLGWTGERILTDWTQLDTGKFRILESVIVTIGRAEATRTAHPSVWKSLEAMFFILSEEGAIHGEMFVPVPSMKVIEKHVQAGTRAVQKAMAQLRAKSVNRREKNIRMCLWLGFPPGTAPSGRPTLWVSASSVDESVAATRGLYPASTSAQFAASQARLKKQRDKILADLRKQQYQSGLKLLPQPLATPTSTAAASLKVTPAPISICRMGADERPVHFEVKPNAIYVHCAVTHELLLRVRLPEPLDPLASDWLVDVVADETCITKPNTTPTSAIFAAAITRGEKKKLDGYERQNRTRLKRSKGVWKTGVYFYQGEKTECTLADRLAS